jgi:hypothetical protein
MKRNQNKRRSKVAISLLLFSIALGVPMGLASYLLNAASTPAPLTVSSGKPTQERSAAGLSKAGSVSGAISSPLVNGMLYTTGSVEVNWGGVRIPVENSSYAFSGGELISTASDAMGILKLDNGSMVFICPNSRVRVSRGSSGETLLEVMAGSGRFMFEDSDAFRVEVNNTTLSAAPDPSSGALTRHAYTGESVAAEDGGCVVCNLSKSLELRVDHGLTKRSAVAKSGQVVSVSGAGDTNPISSFKLPANVFAGMRAAMVSNGATGLGYLCKCRELKDYAEQVGERLAGEPDLTLMSTTLARDEGAPDAPTRDATPTLPQPPDTRPAVAPPPVPDVTVADTGEPDAFVPGLLPAVGETQPQTNTNVVVPPPLVPSSGSGGGGTVSSS